MKKLASTTAALVLAAAASTAFATDNHNNQNGNGHSSHGNGNGYGHNSGECRETPQNPTGQCPPKPATPPASPVTNNNNNSNNQNQGQQQAQTQAQQQQANAAAHAAAQANANANAAGGNAHATGGNAVSNASGGNGGQGGQGGNGGQGGRANVTTGNTTLTNTDNSRTTQNTTLTNTDNSRTTQNTENTTTVTDKSQNNSAAQSSGNNVNVSDNSRTVYKAAANRAAPDAAAIIGDGSCKTGTSFSLGVGTLDVNIGGSIASNKGWSNECADHELRKMEIAADAAREASLRASEDPVEKALAHEQAKQSSASYAGATTTLESRIEQMSVNGQPVEVKNWHGLGGLNVVVKKPVVVTVAPTVAPEAACQPIVNVYLQAARSTGRVAKVETPKTGNTTCDAEVAKALQKAGVAAPKP